MLNPLPWRAAIAGALAAGALAACALNDSGNLAATQLGDVSNPAARGSPVDALVDACGDGAAAPDAPLAREPYLQQVTTRAALVGWVTTTDADQHVEVTTPDGAPIARVRAVTEDTIVPAPGTRQRWARLDGLDPDTTYCYALTGGDRPLTARAGFRTAPTPDDPDPVRFAVLGDSGWGGSDQLALTDQLHTVPYDLIIHVGDLAYPSGTIEQLDDTVFAIYAPLLRHLPLFPVAGNHEYETDDAAPFRAVFALPGNERWYSFDWGRVHVAAIDTEQDLAAQADWLDRDLARTDRPWKIVFLHRPPYSAGDHGSDHAVRAALAPVLEAHGVQLVLAGHDHHYERVRPQAGVHYLVTGGGGRGTRPVGAEAFTAFAEEVIHFVQVEVEPDRLILHAIDGTGVEFDSLVIPREP